LAVALRWARSAAVPVRRVRAVVLRLLVPLRFALVLREDR
jgi:hypothetical protein